ncbi:tetratricopeptide repeat protein [Flavobacterium columnare]|uniref:Tetratricopeptide repeat protein n=1 Tax=Flavobacterium columnare TaxID=996 RepID=A0A437UBU0_9FLAO|nr:tetratricopeptide repeat protein [Flavobacterium columnare]RVU91090.1 tetratricopeptide repeat protein [Flavobacterium columnare]
MKKLLSFALLFLVQTILAQNTNEILVLSAVIKDKVIPNAQVIFQKNGETSLTRTTNASGKVMIPEEFRNTNDLTIIIKKEGYSTLVSKCPCGGLTYAISPFMTELDGMRIVLSWGQRPLDIDSHLSYQGGYVCYYQMDAVNAKLDVDDTDSYGPETITITKKLQGKKYVYAVHNFSDKDKTANSNLATISRAKVYVYIGNTLIKTYTPQAGKMGTVWIPFMIDENGNLADINDYREASSWEGVRTILREYRPSEQQSVVTSADALTAKQINKKGEQEYHAGNYESAINFYQDAIELNPNEGLFYGNLGLVFQKSGKEAEALWANRKAISLASGTTANTVKAGSYYNIARIYEAKNHFQEALENYKLAKQHKENPVYDKAISRVQQRL